LAAVLALTVLGVSAPEGAAYATGLDATSALSAGSRLGLHVTAEELAIWRQRTDSGPYKTKGDVSTNSPGDWNMIVAAKSSFLADPTKARWNGPTKNNPDGCVLGSRTGTVSDPGVAPPRAETEQLRDAAFYALVAQPANGTEIASVVKRELMWQVDAAGTDFTDTDRYCRDRYGAQYKPMFFMSSWTVKLLFAYDYLRIFSSELFTDAETARINAWFNGAAAWTVPFVESRRSGMFTLSGGQYTATKKALTIPSDSDPIWAGGPQMKLIQKRYNNHVPRLARLVTLVGILLDIESYKQVGRNYVKEFLTFAYYPNGAVSDFERWSGGVSHLDGWRYGVEHTGSTMVIADHLARAGDDSLYRYSTTQGDIDTAGATPTDAITNGEPKSLHTLMRQLASYVDIDRRPVRYACASCSDVAHRIDSVDEIKGVQLANEWEMLQSNLYYKDDYFQSIYLRQRGGTPPIPSKPKSVQGRIQGGDTGIYPGVHFMFGQLEGRVQPYPTG